MNQHYVPRVYLKNFAVKKGEEYYVDVFDKQQERHFTTNTRSICAVKNLYTLNENQNVADDVLAMEKMYSHHFEPMYQKSYELLVNDNFVTMNGWQRAEIILGLLHLYMRNPHLLYRALNEHRNNIKRLHKRAISNNQKGLSYLDEDFSFREWDEQSIIKYFEDKAFKVFKEQHIIATKKMGEIHADAVIEVLKITDDSKFITCDKPLSMSNLISQGVDDSPYQRSHEFVIALNTKYAVRIYHDINQPVHGIVRKEIPTGNVALINHEVFKQSERFIIGDKGAIDKYFEMGWFLNETSLKSKFNIIEQILTKFPSTEENSDMKHLLQQYYDKYKDEGTLSKKDEYELLYKIKKLNDIFIHNRIGTKNPHRTKPKTN